MMLDRRSHAVSRVGLPVYDGASPLASLSSSWRDCDGDRRAPTLLLLLLLRLRTTRATAAASVCVFSCCFVRRFHDRLACVASRDAA